MLCGLDNKIRVINQQMSTLDNIFQFVTIPVCELMLFEFDSFLLKGNTLLK